MLTADCSKDGLLTILLTSYNYARYIGKAVQSVIDQTSPEWRLIIYDNLSSDNTLEILKPFLKDPRITLIVRDKNIGARANLIQGLFSVGTEFVAGLQADDFLESTFVEMAINQFGQFSKVPFVFFDWQHYMDDSGLFLDHGRHPFSKKRTGLIRIGPFLSVCNFVPFHLVAFRTKCLINYLKFFDESPLHQVGEQFLLKILEDHYGCGCYSGSIGGYWRRHGEQLTTVHMASAVAQIEEPLERHWYASKAPDPDYTNVFLSLVTFIQLCSHEKYIAALNWLTSEKGFCYAESFGIPVKEEQDRLQSITLAVALKYSTYTAIDLIGESDLNDWLSKRRYPLTYDGLSNFLNEVKQQEGEIFLNSDEIYEICYKFFGQKQRCNDSDYSRWLIRHLWDKNSCQRLLDYAEIHDKIPIIHFLLVVDNDKSSLLNEMISDLLVQALSNWKLTIFSETSCSDTAIKSAKKIEWVQVLCHQEIYETITNIVTSSQADWFVGVPAGLRLSPAFTLLSGVRLRGKPNTLLFYTDEDVINASEEHLQPKFKPDTNIELLRSSPYIGAAVLIHKSLMLDPRIALLPLGLARNYGASLLALERGRDFIDHLDEILVHVPAILTDEYTGTPLAKILVQQHLARCGIVAEVEDGLIPGSLLARYQLPTCPPMVSIVITARSKITQLQTCLALLLEKTDYPIFEVLVVSSESIEPTVKRFLAQLASHDARVRLFHYPCEHNYSRINNFAIREAKGDFVLLLSDDTCVLQENWLEQLAVIGLCDDIGVVGCRLVDMNQRVQHAGVILGIDGAMGSIGVNFTLAERGYMGRAQLAQDFSVVAANCLLIRKSLFLEIDGLDEQYTSATYSGADFCLKIGKYGYRTVWTPFVTLAQQGDGGTENNKNIKQYDDNYAEQRIFVKNWRYRLGNDPAFNRHLSLRQREWVIDGEFDVTWHPDFEPLPRIVAQPPDEMGVGQYRVIGPIKELTQSERICSFLLPALNSAKRFLPSVPEIVRAKPTALFLQNAFTDFHLEHLEEYAELLPDIFRVFGQDDIVFSVPQKSAARKHFGKDTKARVRRGLSLCHRAVVTTEPIAEALRGMIADIRVVPNYLERSRWGDLRPSRSERRKPRVGWAGAQQHGGDLEFILPVVEATANEVDWVFMGMCPPKLRYHVAEAHPAVSFDQYPAALAALDFDLAIAPLELNRFNTAKSNLRLLEYGAAGYPVIATDILPYRNAPVTRVPNNPQAWIKAIREHAHDLAATRVAGERLHEWVLANWMLDQHLDEWLRALLPD